MDLAKLFDPLPDGAGRLGLLSSHEFLPQARQFDAALTKGRSVKRVGVVLCAGHAWADRSLSFAQNHFDAEVVRVFASCAEDEIPEADLYYLAGGNPGDLKTCVSDRDGFWEEILNRWRAGTPLAGSSAGAMVMFNNSLGTCACEDPTHTWGPGLGPLAGIGIAVHADARDPEWLGAMANSAPVPVLAMDEGSGIILEPGQPPKTVGAGRIGLL